MKFNFSSIDWVGLIKALFKAALPFFSGAIGGFLSGCSFYGTGIGYTA